jgi:hypothetical protein
MSVREVCFGALVRFADRKGWSRQARFGTLVREADKTGLPKQARMSIGNENDQASKGHSVDALACTGDEGRDTLR